MRKHLIYVCLVACISCNIHRDIAKRANQFLITDSIAQYAHIGISIYEPATGKYWYEHNPEKYFVPASNTKLFTLYAGLEYLKDSIPAFKVLYLHDTAFIMPTGDPTFLNPEFPQQKPFQYLKAITLPLVFINSNWKEEALGYGWSWDDFESDDMIERNSFPIYNNVIRFSKSGYEKGRSPSQGLSISPETNWEISIDTTPDNKEFTIHRHRTDNIYNINLGSGNRKLLKIPFVTRGLKSALGLLTDTLHKMVSLSGSAPPGNYTVINSRPADSLFTTMMHRSDNFFAEQTLLMVSNEKLGYMNDVQIINYLITHDLTDIPQKPSWKDGSGLSRYNLFCPRDFVYILKKLETHFGFDRIKHILATGGTGTLASLYKKDSGYIYAKTGTLSNNVALSGYLITKQHKFLVFSILVNHFVSSAPPIRKAIESFLSGIRQHY